MRKRWLRIENHPCLPLGDNRSMVTGCKEHIELSRKSAEEGIVLLKNNNNLLPLKNSSKIAIFGKAQIDYVKGGGGSGDVICEYVKNIYQSFKAEFDVLNSLSLFYQSHVEQKYKEGFRIGRVPETEIPKDLLKEAKEYTDTAIITIGRYSKEEEDHRNDETDAYFNLDKQEQKMVDTVCANFENVIVLLNTGAMIDTSWFSKNDKIKSALMIWQGGMEGTVAAANVVSGKVTPSGKLVDTCAEKFEDYPSSEGFHQSEDYVKYTEDVFVGYRYFETIPGKQSCVVYPFGYGLSYTTFEFSEENACVSGGKIVVSVTVKNIGKYAGKEVVQLYYNPPVGVITKPKFELCAFAKTKLLAPNESQNIVLSFDISSMASYDDIGDVQKSAWVMEKGDYKLFIGNSVRNTKEIDFTYSLNENIVTEQCTEYCKPESLGKRLTATGEYKTVENCKVTRKTFEPTYNCKYKEPKEEEIKKLADVANGNITLDEFMKQLSDQDMMKLLLGKKNTGVANTDGMGGNEKFGIPAPMTVDGPAGVRLSPSFDIYTTAFPVATMLACTWNTEILEQVGTAGAKEAKENNLSMWLTPALNIHRSPLCGRNFEYYSEDPFVSGKMASAMVRGIQSQNIVATPKHFACNNKETNRKESNSIVSERAIREIYVKGFEICVKEANPKLLMTAYNRVNGARSSENTELITGVLRNEWGYKGLVTTDWWNNGERSKEIKAGNDVHMPHSHYNIWTPFPWEVENVSRNQLATCVKRLLELILWLE